MARKLLTIDNSKIIHPLIRATLGEEGLEFHSAYEGEAGLAAAASLRPDVILLDVDMPQLNGFEVCDRLKSNPATQNIPVIFITAARSTDEKIKGLDKGAVDYVTKPFEPSELLARVRAALRIKHLVDLLEHIAMVDAVTGLRNRAYVDHRLTREREQPADHGRSHLFVIGKLLDWRRINEVHGRLACDELLRKIGGLLRQESGGDDVACRYAEDEFVIILSDSEPTRAAAVAERLRQGLSQLGAAFGGSVIEIAGSFDVAASTPGESPLSTLQRASCEAGCTKPHDAPSPVGGRVAAA